MKRALLFFVLLLASKGALAQNTTPVCGIFYDYDAVGQRIKRMYDCRQPPDGSGEIDPGSTSRKTIPNNDVVTDSSSQQTSSIKVYPNPTAGPYTISLSAAPKEPVHYHWYSERGQILGSGTISGQQAKGDIATWADGMYLLQVYMPTGTESFRVVKVTTGQ